MTCNALNFNLTKYKQAVLALKINKNDINYR